MVTENTHLPNVKDVQEKKRELSEEKIKFLQDLRTKVANDLSNRTNWQSKMIASINQRMGIKRWSNWPYPGAPDIPLPETDKLIKKALPNLVLSAWQVKNMCLVDIEDGYQTTPELKEKARRAQLRMNSHLRSNKLDWFKKLLLGADNLKTYGMAIFRIFEEFKRRKVNKVIDLTTYEPELIKSIKSMYHDDKVAFIAQRFGLDAEDETDLASIKQAIKQLDSGDDIVEFEIEEYENYPNVEVLLPTKIILPNYTTDIQSAPRITYEYFLTEEKLQEKIDKQIFFEKDLKDLPAVAHDEDLVESQKSRQEGISEKTEKGDLYRIHETLCWYKDGKQYRRWVFTRFADIEDPDESLCQDMPFPYEFNAWNYVKIDNETRDPRYYSSRGTPEQIRAIQEILERCINNMIIRDEFNNMPVVEVLETSGLLDTSIRMVPGMKLPVKALGQEIAPLNRGNIPDVSGMQLMQLLKAYAEEYVGSIDQLFRNATNMGGGKTLGEVEQGIQAASGNTMLEVINWNDGLSKVYKMMFDIFKERVEDSAFIGETEITREDFQINAEVKSNGNLEVADKEMATQRAFLRLNTIVSPALMDIVTPEDKYNAVKDWLEKDGVKDPDQFCTDPKKIMQDQGVQMKQALMQAQQQLQGMQQQAQQEQKNAVKAKQAQKDAITQIQAQKEMLGGSYANQGTV